MMVEQFFKQKIRTELDNGKVKWDFRNNLTKLTIGNLLIFFSFETPVAIAHPTFHRTVEDKSYYKGYRDKTIYVCDNFWGKGTAYHLNLLDDGKTDDRVSREFIKEKIKELLPKELEDAAFPWQDYDAENAPFIGRTPPEQRYP